MAMSEQLVAAGSASGLGSAERPGDARVEAKIDSLLQRGERDGSALVGIVAESLKLLQGMGWAWHARIAPREVGVDPENRDGYGVNGADVHALGHDIAHLGWDWAEVKGAVCVEEAPASGHIRSFNEALATKSPDLAPVEPETLRYGSVASSHTNMFLRAVAAGVASEDPYCSRDGRLSLDKLRERDGEFAKAVEFGLTWLVLSHKVRHRFPKLLGLVQGARNAPAQIARREHEVQVMMRMQGLASGQQRSSGSVDWEAIRAAVLRSRPPCGNYIVELQAFVATCGGGASGQFLQDLFHFHQACVNSERRVVKGWYFAALANIEMEGEIPFLKLALVKTQYSSPEEKLRDKDR